MKMLRTYHRTVLPVRSVVKMLRTYRKGLSVRSVVKMLRTYKTGLPVRSLVKMLRTYHRTGLPAGSMLKCSEHTEKVYL